MDAEGKGAEGWGLASPVGVSIFIKTRFCPWPNQWVWVRYRPLVFELPGERKDCQWLRVQVETALPLAVDRNCHGLYHRALKACHCPGVCGGRVFAPTSAGQAQNWPLIFCPVTVTLRNPASF